jgi:hypothetical protein
VSRFLLEEEVLHSSGVKSPSKQRETLIKFLVIISIAVSLEALVFIFDAGKKDISNLIYPTFLLIAAVLLVIGLGVYQKLTRDEAPQPLNSAVQALDEEIEARVLDSSQPLKAL